MTRAQLDSGIELEYDTFGSPDDPALLLVMGFTAQMILWNEEFCEQLAASGRYVIRFDNRDCGLSTKLDGQHVDAAAVLGAAMAGEEIPPVPYMLSDMAADAIGLLDALGIDRAHVAGASMGGMIVQTMAIEHPDRLLSVTSIMSTVGDPEYGAAAPEAMAVLLSPPPAERDQVIERAASTRIWASKRYFDEAKAKEFAGVAYDRSFYPEGASRQLAAITASGDRSDGLRSVSTPMLVIHGLDDTLIAPSGGRRTAELVPNAHLLEVADMGHDVPPPLYGIIVGAMIGHQESAVHPSAAAPLEAAS
ncbi:MAG: alpha/beta hydrolase [Ilumatobacter fluminis]|uniref:alpha/beta fold hydrolase n=1 Tax=Ilumatobacter fluminis TaxID=467091 RepID=UPI0032ED2C10